MNINQSPFIIFQLNGKSFCEQENQEFIMPNFLTENANQIVQGFILNEAKITQAQIEVSCLEEFKGVKKIHFYNAPKQERDKTKGFREILNRTKITILQ